MATSGYDTTGNKWHFWINGSDRKFIGATNDGGAGQPCLSNADGTCTVADPITSGNQGAATTQTITATGALTGVTVTNIGTVLITVSGTYAGVAFNFEGTPDGTFSPAFLLNASQLDAASIVTATGALPSNTTRAWLVDAAGMTKIRLNATAWTSGTANITVTPVYHQFVPWTHIDGTVSANLNTGSNVVGKVGIDQTTPGTTNGVQVNAALPAGANRIGKTTVRNSADSADIDPLADSTFTGRINTQGQKTMSASTPVVLASDQSSIPAAATLQAGSAVVGKVGIDQTTPGTTNGVQVNAALPAGSNVIGKVSIDQTTPGTTNGVQVNAALPAGANRIGKATIRNSADSADIDPLADSTFTGRINTQGQKAMAASTPVVLASDQSSIPAAATLQAGSAVVGKVGIDQTTPGTTNGVQVNAALPAGANRIGKTTVRNSADSADIDPLADSTFTGRINTQGQKAMAASTPVVLASDQSAIPVQGAAAAGAAMSGDSNPIAEAGSDYGFAGGATPGQSATKRTVYVDQFGRQHIVCDQGCLQQLVIQGNGVRSMNFGVQLLGSFGRQIRSINDGLAVTLTAPVPDADPCSGRKQNLAISQTGSTRLLTAVPGVVVFCSGIVVASDAESVSLVEGTGATCGTGTLGILGGTTAAAGMAFAANGGITQGNGKGTIAGSKTPGNDVCLLQSGAGTVAGNLTYVIAPPI
jgi:hypothetical protein